MNRDFIIDGHCDTLSNLLDKSLNINSEENHISLNKLIAGNVGIQFFAAWIGPRPKYGSPLKRALRLIDTYYQMLSSASLVLRPILGYGDIKSIKENQLGTILTIEGGEVLEGELSNLRILYKLGVRLMTLTWNHRNEIGDGVMETSAQGGLSMFGADVVKEMNRLGMIIDVSHLSERGFWDVISLSETPIIASHSNAAALCKHPRNLSDEQIKALHAKNGLIGINFYPSFLSENKASIDDIIKHIEYIAALTNIDILGFGSDFDGIETLPIGVEGPQSFPIIIERLLRLNYKEEDVRKIMYKNYLRLLKSIL